MVTGKVHLIFFDTMPVYVEATGKTYEEIKEKTKRIAANGGTSIGCGLMLASERKLEADGIAIVSDGAENNSPMFTHVYPPYCHALGKQVPIYFYRTGGTAGWSDMDLANSLKMARIDFQEFDLRGQKVDFYSLPNLAATMKTRRYDLVQEILDVPLLKLDEVLKPVGRDNAAA
jgi:hypothetical protein